jgi:hypothetical protein
MRPGGGLRRSRQGSAEGSDPAGVCLDGSAWTATINGFQGPPQSTELVSVSWVRRFQEGFISRRQVADRRATSYSKKPR